MQIRTEVINIISEKANAKGCAENKIIITTHAAIYNNVYILISKSPDKRSFRWNQ